MYFNRRYSKFCVFSILNILKSVQASSFGAWSVTMASHLVSQLSFLFLLPLHSGTYLQCMGIKSSTWQIPSGPLLAHIMPLPASSVSSPTWNPFPPPCHWSGLLSVPSHTYQAPSCLRACARAISSASLRVLFILRCLPKCPLFWVTCSDSPLEGSHSHSLLPHPVFTSLISSWYFRSYFLLVYWQSPLTRV